MKKADSRGVQDFRKLWEGYFLQRVVMDESRKGIVCALNWDTLQLGQPADGSSYQVAWWSDEQGRYAIEQCEACDSKKLAAMATEDFDELPAPATNDPLTMLLVKPLYQANFKMTEQEYANRLQKAGKEYARLGALSAAEAQRVKELIAARKQQKPQQQQQEEEAEEEVAAAPAKGKMQQQKQSAGKASGQQGTKQTASKVPKGKAAKAGKAAAAGPSKAAATAAGAKKKAPAPAAAAAPAPAKQSVGKKTAAAKPVANEETAAAATAAAPSTKRKAGTAAAATATAVAAKKTRK